MDQNPNVQICQTDEIWIRNGVRVNPRRQAPQALGRHLSPQPRTLPGEPFGGDDAAGAVRACGRLRRVLSRVRGLRPVAAHLEGYRKSRSSPRPWSPGEAVMRISFPAPRGGSTASASMPSPSLIEAGLDAGEGRMGLGGHGQKGYDSGSGVPQARQRVHGARVRGAAAPGARKCWLRWHCTKRSPTTAGSGAFAPRTCSVGWRWAKRIRRRCCGSRATCVSAATTSTTFSIGAWRYRCGTVAP